MNWRTVFGLHGHVTFEDIVSRHRCLAKQHHPDLGGSVAIMQEINAARAAAISELKGDRPVIGLGPMMRRRKHPPRRSKRSRE